MLNNTFKQDLSFNSVSGTLVKSASNSKFTRFHMNSPRAEYMLCDKPTINGRGDNPVEILQVMICGGDQFLVEYINIDVVKI